MVKKEPKSGLTQPQTAIKPLERNKKTGRIQKPVHRQFTNGNIGNWFSKPVQTNPVPNRSQRLKHRIGLIQRFGSSTVRFTCEPVPG